MGQIEHEVLEAARHRRRRRPPDHRLHRLARSPGDNPRDRHPERHRFAEDVRHPVPDHRRRAELRHRVPRHPDLPGQRRLLRGRIRRGALDRPARAGHRRGDHHQHRRRARRLRCLRPGASRSRMLLQMLLTLLVIPFVFPLVAMVQGSLAGAGWDNYTTVLSLPLLPGFFINSALVAVAVILDRAGVHHDCRVRVLQAPHPRERGLLLDAARRADPARGGPASRHCSRRSPGSAPTTRSGPSSCRWPRCRSRSPSCCARNFVDGIPDALIEAARVDGAGMVRAFWHVMLPLTKPIIAADRGAGLHQRLERVPARRCCSCRRPNSRPSPWYRSTSSASTTTTRPRCWPPRS